MQYENNLANGFQDIVRDETRTHRRMARHGDGNIPTSYYVGGVSKKELTEKKCYCWASVTESGP